MIESISASHGHGAPIDFSEKLLSNTNDIIARAAFGKKCKEQEEFISPLDEITKLTRGYQLSEAFPSPKFLGYVTGLEPAIKKSHKEIDSILDIIIN